MYYVLNLLDLLLLHLLSEIQFWDINIVKHLIGKLEQIVKSAR
jgi:hypothetical protein